MGAASHARGIEAIAVRRTSVVDADKVRYRVYSTPTEFVAVIAESALMAVRVAGIQEPYRIVRDLPTKEVSIAADRVAKASAAQKVTFATTPKEKSNAFKAVLSEAPATDSNARFMPMHLKDLNQKKSFDGFIVPHEVLNQLIDAMRTPEPPAPEVKSEIPSAATVTDPVPEEAMAPPAAAVEATPKEPGEVLSSEEVEKLLSDG